MGKCRDFKCRGALFRLYIAAPALQQRLVKGCCVLPPLRDPSSEPGSRLNHHVDDSQRSVWSSCITPFVTGEYLERGHRR
jgi:hypothetical protein